MRYLLFLTLFLTLSCETVTEVKDYLWPPSQKKLQNSNNKNETIKKNKTASRKEKSDTKEHLSLTDKTTKNQKSVNKASYQENKKENNLIKETISNQKTQASATANPADYFDRKSSYLKEVKQKAVPSESDNDIKLIHQEGGELTAVYFDGTFLYLAFGSQLLISNTQFQIKASSLRPEEIIRVDVFPSVSERIIFLSYSNNQIDIIKYNNKSFEEIKTLELEGTLESLVQNESDKNQKEYFLSEKNKDSYVVYRSSSDFRFLSDIAFNNKNIESLLPLGEKIYLSHNKNLEIISTLDKSLLSSLQIGDNFHILNRIQLNKQDYLVLLIEKNKLWTALSYIPLNSDGEVLKPGENISLSQAYQSWKLSSDRQTLYLEHEGKLSLFDLMLQREDYAKMNPFSEVKDFTGAKNLVFSFDDTQIQMNRFKRLEHFAGLKNSPSENKIINIEWIDQKNQIFAQFVDHLIFNGPKELLLFNNLSSSPPLFFKNNFNSAGFPSPFPNLGNTNFDFTLWVYTPDGILAYDEKTELLYGIDMKRKSLTKVDLPKQKILGLDVLKNKDSQKLIIASGGSEKEIQIYLLSGDWKFKKEGSFKLETTGAIKVLKEGDRALMACGKEGLCLLNFNEKKIMRKAIVADKTYSSQDILFSPGQHLAFIYSSKDDDQAMLSVFRLKGKSLKKASIISNLKLSLEQFRALSFSSGGQVLVLPHYYGISLFNLRDPKKISLWNKIESGMTYSVDVTNRGQTLCAALGEKGVRCYDLPKLEVETTTTESTRQETKEPETEKSTTEKPNSQN